MITTIQWLVPNYSQHNCEHDIEKIGQGMLQEKYTFDGYLIKREIFCPNCNKLLKSYKYCSRCGEYKNTEEYYKDRTRKDGLTVWCKLCSRIKDTRPHRRSYRAKWNRDNIDRVKIAVEKYVAKYPEKNKARIILRKAVKDGKIIRQACEICGSIKSHGHHRDYNKPLEVRWLCPLHHRQVHVGIIK